MNPQKTFYYVSLWLLMLSCNRAKISAQQDISKPANPVKERLDHPFGTLLKLKVKILDGRSLNDKGHQSDFLFTIESIDSVVVTQPVVMEFRDETGRFPTDNFELYKHLYGRDTGVIDEDMNVRMKKEYVGHEYNIVAYESGAFTGTPEGYSEYQPERQDLGFHFNNYLVVIADLAKK